MSTRPDDSRRSEENVSECINAIKTFIDEEKDWQKNKVSILDKINILTIWKDKQIELTAKLQTEIELLKYKSGFWGYIGGIISLASILLIQYFLKK